MPIPIEANTYDVKGKNNAQISKNLEIKKHHSLDEAQISSTQQPSIFIADDMQIPCSDALKNKSAA